MVHDLRRGLSPDPAGRGYRATVLAGRVVSENGEFTEERPGALIRRSPAQSAWIPLRTPP